MVKSNFSFGSKLLLIVITILVWTLVLALAIGGGLYYAYKNVKVKKILSLIGQEDLLSSEYAENTISDLVKDLQATLSGDITLQKLADISPYLDEKVNAVIDEVDSLGYVTIDRDALYTTSLSNIGDNFEELFAITASFNTLSENLGFDLPGIPYIAGGAEGEEIWIYTRINGTEDGQIDKDFSALQPDAYYTHALEYLPANSLSPYKVWSLAGAKISDDGQIRVTVDGADRIVYAAYAQDAYTPLNESSDLVLNENGTLLFKTDQLFYKTPASDTAYTALNPDPAGERSEWVISAEYEYVPLYAKSGDDYVLVTVEEGDGYAVDGENGGFLIPEDKKSQQLYYAHDRYDEIEGELTEEFLAQNAVYIRTNGIADLPVTQALTAFSAAFDMTTLTLDKAGLYFGVDMDNEMLDSVKYVPFAYLSDGMEPALQQIEMADVLGNPDHTDSRVILFLAYGQEGAGYTLVLDEGGNPVGIDIRHRNTFKEALDLFDSLRVRDVIDIDEDNNLLNAIKDWTMEDMGNTDVLYGLTLGQVIPIGEDALPILKALADTPIGELSGSVGELTLGEMIEIADDSLLAQLRGEKLEDLDSAVNRLEIKLLYADSIYDYQEVVTDGAGYEDARALYPELFTYENGSYTLYTGDGTDSPTLYAKYVYAGTADSVSADYTGVPLYKFIPAADGQTEGSYELVTKAVGWKIPEGKKPSGVNTFYVAKEDGSYTQISPDADGVFAADTIWYLDTSTDKMIKLSLETAKIGLDESKAEAGERLYSRMRYVSANYDAHGNLWYYDAAAGVYKAAEKTEQGAYVTDEDKTYYTYGEVNGIWRYLLLDADTQKEESCTVENLASLVLNVSANINKATLNDLYRDGLLQLDDPTILGKTISLPPAFETDEIGTYSIQGLVDLIATLAN